LNGVRARRAAQLALVACCGPWPSRRRGGSRRRPSCAAAAAQDAHRPRAATSPTIPCARRCGARASTIRRRRRGGAVRVATRSLHEAARRRRFHRARAPPAARLAGAFRAAGELCFRGDAPWPASTARRWDDRVLFAPIPLGDLSLRESDRPLSLLFALRRRWGPICPRGTRRRFRSRGAFGPRALGRGRFLIGGTAAELAQDFAAYGKSTSAVSKASGRTHAGC